MGGHARDDLTGQTLLGKLRVIRKLGEGGMGAVYEVEHLLTRHHRALKVLHRDVAFVADVVARFVREAGVAGTVSSPHVVQTFDAGQLEDSSPYVLMELLRGETLATMLAARTRIDPGEAVDIAMQIATGLDAAHTAGIIHRDLKPENVFLCEGPEGRASVKILDFGISKFTDLPTRPGAAKTETGAILGTPAYMAPEQMAGAKDVDVRADVYALGVVVYEMISGTPPFQGTTLLDLVLKVHLGDHEQLDRRATWVDGAMAAVVERALAREPSARWPSAMAFAEALAPFRGSRSVRATGPIATADVGLARTEHASSGALRRAVDELPKTRVSAPPVGGAGVAPRPTTEAPVTARSWVPIAIVTGALAVVAAVLVGNFSAQGDGAGTTLIDAEDDAGVADGFDAGVDAGTDAGHDAGQDAGHDAGRDAGRRTRSEQEGIDWGQRPPP